MSEGVTLGEVCQQIVDCEHKTAPVANPGEAHAFSVGTPSIRSGRLILAASKLVNRETFEAWTARAVPQEGDVILTREAPVGEAAYVDGSVRVCLGQRTVLLRPDPGRVYPRFLHYLLLTPAIQERMRSQAEGSTLPHLNVREIRDLKLDALPSLDVQRSIASTLAALERKITINEQSVTYCDNLRRLLYDEFVLTRFEDVSNMPLSSTADFVNGRAFTKSPTGTGRMVIRIAELNSGPGGSTVYNDIDVPKQHLARPGDVLFAWSGSLTVARWFREESVINQHIFKVVPRAAYPTWLIFELVSRKLDEFRFIAAGKATTMGHIQRHHLDEPVLVPSDEVVSELDVQLRPLWDRALAAEQESLALGRLRDAILPPLMSGEIRVRDGEKAIEHAT